MSDLSQAETHDLRALVHHMIPASADYNVPGADDDLIFADILASFERDLPQVHVALADLAKRAGGNFADLPPDRQSELIADFRAHAGVPLTLLHRVVLLCYYRDDRVMRSLGLEPRPPFPLGHKVEQGDWSLLDPVRTRAPFWRQV